MFTTIFRKLLTSYITVLSIGFILLAVVLNITMHNFLIGQSQQTLQAEATKALQVIAQIDGDPSLYPQFEKLTAFYRKAFHTKVDVLLIDETGMNQMAKKLMRSNDMLNPSILKRVLSGKVVKNVGAFKKSDNEVVLSLGVPIQKNGKVIGALFLHTPVHEIHTKEVSKLILVIALIVGIPAIIALYLISRKISLPLVRMNRAAKLIGTGNFKERIAIESRDEVGELAATFNQMAEQLEKLESMRKELIANVSHELRTPLTSVRGFIQGMREGVIAPEQHKRYLDISYKELNRLSQLLNTMLDLAAIETGRVTLNPVAIRWLSLVESVEDSVRVRMEEKQISFQIIHPVDEKILVFGDPERLKQVLFNLLDNAIRHTPEGGSIVLSSKPSGRQVLVEVSDTGSGIPPEKLSLIWEKFYTEDSSRTSRQERSGLGLTITRNLVELMGGTIEVQSALGKGTTFRLLLPVPPEQRT